MSIMSDVLERLRSLAFRAREERDIDEELRFHIEMQTEANLRAGMSPGEAQRQAFIALGGIQRFKEEWRDARGVRWLDDLTRDVRYALRRLVRQPGFSVPVVLTLAIGIGAVAAIFALVSAVLLRPLPYHDSARLVAIRHTAPGIGVTEGGISDGIYLHYLKHNRVFDGMGLYHENDDVSLTDRDNPRQIRVALVTPSLFSVLGTTPFLGRLFVTGDGKAKGPVPVVISYDLWVGRYGADPGLVGRTIELNRVPHEVVGVLPSGFDFPRAETKVWYAWEAEPWPNVRAGGLEENAIARLKAGISPQVGQADLQRLIASLPDAYPAVTPEDLQRAQLRAEVIPLKDAVVGDASQPLVILLFVMGFVLIIAWANVANLLLVRGERQHREVAVVQALGAARWDLTRRFLCESLILTVLGSALGLALASAAVRSRFGFAPGQIPRLHEVHVGDAVALTVGLFLVSTLLLATISIGRAQRADFTAALKGAHGRTTGGRDWQRAQRSLVTLQVALALTLLIGSAVMVQSFWRLAHAPLGFDPEGMLTFQLSLPYAGYEKYQDGARFHARLLEEIRAIPGVTAAGATFDLPLTRTGQVGLTGSLEVEGVPRLPDDVVPPITISFATPEYFRAMRIPLVRGRSFRAGDLFDKPRPVVVSAATVRDLFGDRDPIGRRIRIQPSYFPEFVVVGVAGDVPDETVAGGPSRLVYFPDLNDLAQQPQVDVNIPYVPSDGAFVVCTSLPPTSLIPTIRRLVHDLDPKVPVTNVRTMDQIVSASMARTRLLMLLLLVAGCTALLLGVIGLYGVVSYAVAERRREIGVRIALGASPAAVSRMVIRQSAVVATFGIIAGVVAALALTRFLRGLLYEVSPVDPLAFAVTPLFLFVITMVAGYVPARRASRIDPIEALKAE